MQKIIDLRLTYRVGTRSSVTRIKMVEADNSFNGNIIKIIKNKF